MEKCDSGGWWVSYISWRPSIDTPTDPNDPPKAATRLPLTTHYHNRTTTPLRRRNAHTSGFVRSPTTNLAFPTRSSKAAGDSPGTGRLGVLPRLKSVMSYPCLFVVGLLGGRFVWGWWVGGWGWWVCWGADGRVWGLRAVG
jgi:hypothetical protein